mmetsp:Transcript_17332/g.48286  ORF Transcript_17332/g.48286 Transcript_17332/m.48286 type:complete len:485 (-) Transcript_17332:1465-2919(-)
MFSLGPSLPQEERDTPVTEPLGGRWSFALEKNSRKARRRRLIKTALQLPRSSCHRWATSQQQAAVDSWPTSSTQDLITELPGAGAASDAMPGKESQGTAANQGGAFWQAPFVPSIMVGWMHTLTDRQLFLDPPQGEGDSEDEHFGQLPSEIKGAGLDMENEIRRHRQAMKRLGSRMQPFFVSDEAMAVYKLLMTGELPDDIEAVLQGKAPQTGRSKEEREGGKEGEEDVEKGNEQAAASKPSTSSQTRVTSLKAAMAVLCAFPERTCVIRSEIDEEEIEEPLHNRGGGGGSWCPWWRWNGKEAKDKQASGGQAAAVVKKGTPVFTVPGVYISIDSILGPMKMRPLFLKHSLLYDMLDAAERLLIKAAMVRRRTAREDTRRKILTVLSLVTGTHGASAGPPEESEDAGEEEDDGGMDPPEVNEFLAEMGEGGSSGNRGARPPQGPLGVVSTIAFGTIAVALSTVGLLTERNSRSQTHGSATLVII